MIQQRADSVKATQVLDSLASLNSFSLEVLLQTHDTLVQIVIWTLATVIAITLALLAFGWYSNFRIAERERQALRNHLEELIESEMSDATRKLHEMARKQSEDIQETLESQRKKLGQLARKEGKRHAENVNQQLQELRLDVQLEKVERERRNGVPSVFETVRLLDIARESGWSWRISEALELVEEAVRKDKTTVQAGVEADLATSLDALEDNYSTVVSRIRKLLKDR